MSEPIISEELVLWCDGLNTHRKLGKIETVRDFVPHIAALEAENAELKAKLAAAEQDIKFLEKEIRHALNNDAGWDLSSKAMLEPINRMVRRMRENGATPEEAKAAFDLALAAAQEEGE